MRIPPEFLECVAFLCARNRRGVNAPGGTAFFVAVQDETDKARQWSYAVTARHSLDEIVGQEVVLRVPATQEQAASFKDVRTRKDDWQRHDHADVAAIPFTKEASHQFRELPLNMFVNRDYQFIPHRLAQYERAITNRYGKMAIPMQLGDDLFFPGLFVQSAGKNTMLPMARFGNISRMPGEEPVLLETRTGKIPIRAYLAETHSWGGHSGSPVFCHFEFDVRGNLSPEERAGITNEMLPFTPLLGMVSGHFNIGQRIKRITGSRRSVSKLEAAMNSGIAVVTPAENIKELLLRSDLVEERRRASDTEEQNQPVAIADADFRVTQHTLAPKKKARIEIPIPTRDQFLDDLARATQRRKPSS